MKILAIDTSTEACSAALFDSGQVISRFEIAPQKHSELILPMCEQLLAEAQMSQHQLNAIAFGRGPGSFTGLRIAAGVTQGIAFAADLPVIAVSTLAALAQKVSADHPQSQIIAAMDARMQEIYWAIFSLENDVVKADSEEKISKPEHLYPITTPFVAVGSGWKEYAESLTQKFRQCDLIQIYPDYLPSAHEMAHIAATQYQLGNLLPAEQALPVYLRNEVVKKPAPQPLV